MSEEMNNEEVLNQVKELLKQKKSKYHFFEKIIIPALIPIVLGILAYVTSNNGHLLAERQLEQNKLYQTQTVLNSEKQFQAHLLELCYDDLMGTDTVRLRKAIKLINLLDPVVRHNIATWIQNNPQYPDDIRQKAGQSRNIVEGFMWIGDLKNDQYTFQIRPIDNSKIKTLDDIVLLNGYELVNTERLHNLRTDPPPHENYTLDAIIQLPIESVVTGRDKFKILEVLEPYIAKGRKQYWARVEMTN